MHFTPLCVSALHADLQLLGVPACGHKLLP